MNELDQMRALADASKAVQEYAGSDAFKQLDLMLHRLSECYKAELADVMPENLVRVQAQLRQTQIIRDVIKKNAQLPKL